MASGEAAHGIVRGKKRPSFASLTLLDYAANYAHRHRQARLRSAHDSLNYPTSATVTDHRVGLLDLSSMIERIIPATGNPFNITTAVSPRYWAKRQRRASRGSVISIVCIQHQWSQYAIRFCDDRHRIREALTKPFRPTSRWPVGWTGGLSPSWGRQLRSVLPATGWQPFRIALPQSSAYGRRQTSCRADRGPFLSPILSDQKPATTQPITMSSTSTATGGRW